MNYTLEELRKKYKIRPRKEEDFIRDLIKKLGIIKSRSQINSKLKKLLINSIQKRSQGKIGVLFSGGIDSTVITVILRHLKKDFTCYVAGIGESEDIAYSKKVAKKLNLKLKIIQIKENELEKYLKKVISVIKTTDVTKVGVALPFYLALEQAKKDKITTIFGGLGSEEIFAGYQRHKQSTDINKECIRGLIRIKERDLDRDNALCNFFKIKPVNPYLDEELVDYALRIPSDMKIKNNKEKLILRQVGKDLGVPSEVVNRKKKAAQYGSNSIKFLQKLAKKKGFKYKKDYLRNMTSK